jgi:mRNA-degrading endonuclease RelE of RelBE toxin-antitoxin system
MYTFKLSPEAIDDLDSFRKFEQRQIIDGIKKQLLNEPGVETRNRKRLRPNQLAEWELRVGDFRVFYDIDETIELVTIEAVGHKHGSTLFVHGEEFEL